MAPLDRQIHQCQALVIDPNPTSRSILSSQLRDFGVTQVSQCSRIPDARRQLESRTFDLVLCESEFHDDGCSGQQLLDDLRRNQLLPLSTVFIMITGEATYSLVADAAESALDSYLLKPHTAAVLGERISQARSRKKSLSAIFDAIEEQDFHEAAHLCLERFEQRGRYWMYAARIGSELLLRLGRHDEARALYEAVLKTGALPWAKLGIARAQLESNQPTQAMRTLEGLIGENPTYVDAYDVMGRVHIEQGDLSQALETYRKASLMTPGSLGRLQKLGMLAFYSGQYDEAARTLDKAVSAGISSKMFDYQSLVLLAFCRFKQKDGKGLQRCLDNLDHALSRAPASVRLQRFVSVVQAFNLMMTKQVAAALAEIKHLAGQIDAPNFDVEAACNTASMLSQLTAAELVLDGVELWIDRIALRYTGTKSLTELLACAASAHEPFSQRVRQGHQRINELAEQALAHALRGDRRKAVCTLIGHGEQTRNGKLIDMARMSLQRHAAQIEDAASLSQTIEALRTRWASGVSLPTMGSGSRQAGGVVIPAGRAKTAAADNAQPADAATTAPPPAPGLAAA